jgi:hypothetical protein
LLQLLLWPAAAQSLLHPKTGINDAAVVNDFWPVASECDFAAAILKEFEVSKTRLSYVLTSLFISITIA